MSIKPAATRRTFFGRAGAALLAPLAAATSVAGENGDDLASRLAALEDANAIRGLLQRHAQGINAGTHATPARGVRTLSLDAEIAIEVAGDGTATARADCSVEMATPISGRDTLVEMARLQGEGIVKRSERRVLVGSLAKHGGIWRIEQLELRA